MSAAVFYVLATLVIAAALLAVLAPSTRLSLIGIVATDVLVGVLLIAAGAQLLGAIAVLAPALCLLGTGAVLQRNGYRALFADLPAFARRWGWIAAVSGTVGVLLVWTAASSADDTASNTGSASLLSLLHYRAPVGLGVAVVLAVASVTGALLIGRTGDDERHLDRAAEQRRLRDQRAAARREQRAAARAQRGRNPEGTR